MNAALADLDEADRDRLVRTPPPIHAAPMKAVLTDRRFSDPSWIFERKLDGIRCVAIRDGSSVRLLSRNDLPLNDRYPEIAEALAGNRCKRFAIDGEVVAFDGAPDELLAAGPAQAARRPGVPLRLRRPLARRLRRPPGRRCGAASACSATASASRIRSASPRTATRSARSSSRRPAARGWEGLIAKRAGLHLHRAPLARLAQVQVRARARSSSIGGYTDPQGTRTGFGALLLGYYEGGELLYAGRVGTGFDDATLASLGRRLEHLGDAGQPVRRPALGRRQAEPTGSSPSSSPRSGSPSGPGTAASAIRGSSGSGTTSPLPRWSASDERDDPRRPPLGGDQPSGQGDVPRGGPDEARRRPPLRARRPADEAVSPRPAAHLPGLSRRDRGATAST